MPEIVASLVAVIGTAIAAIAKSTRTVSTLIVLICATLLIRGTMQAQGDEIDEKVVSGKVTTVTKARQVFATDAALIVATDTEVHFVTPSETRNLGKVAQASVADASKGFGIISAEGVSLYSGEGRLLHKYESARPIFGTDGIIHAVFTRQKGGHQVVFVDGDAEEAVALPKFTHATVIDSENKIILISTILGPFKPAVRLEIWKGSTKGSDLAKEYPGSRCLGATQLGRIYLLSLKDGKQVLAAIDVDGKELWTRMIGKERRSVLFKVATISDGTSKHDMVVLGHEDDTFRDQPGKLKMALIGSDGKEIADLSNVSYNRPVVSSDSRYMLLAGRKEIWSMEISTGKVLWKMNAEKFLDGHRAQDTRQGSSAFVRNEPAYWIAMRADKDNRLILARSLQTGEIVYKKSLSGPDWKMHPSLSGRTMWLVSADGQIIQVPSRMTTTQGAASKPK